MVGRRVIFTCEKCRSEHRDYDAARSCEMGHIVNDAIDHLDAKLKAIFAANDKRYRTKRRNRPA